MDMQEKYEALLEKITGVSVELLGVSKRMEENTRQLNDSFVLHSQKMTNVESGVDTLKNLSIEIKGILLKYLRYAVVIAFIAVGGGTIISKINIESLFK